MRHELTFQIGIMHMTYCPYSDCPDPALYNFYAEPGSCYRRHNYYAVAKDGKPYVYRMPESINEVFLVEDLTKEPFIKDSHWCIIRQTNIPWVVYHQMWLDGAV